MSSALWLATIAFLLALLHAAFVSRWRELLQRYWSGPSEGMPSSYGGAISVVVPVRDGEATIVDVLQDLYKQQGVDGRMEVIVVLDHCTDATWGSVSGMQPSWPDLRSVQLTDTFGKKAAITAGVEAARHPIILVTDADVRMGTGRVGRVLVEMHHRSADLLLLPVKWARGEGVLGALQQEEQAALMGAAMATGLEGRPVLANGANMAFRKEAFLKVGGYTGDTWASGDDMFLLQRMQRNGARIGMCLAPETVVEVRPETTWRAWWQQRLRWAGKMRAYRGEWGMLAGAVAVLFPWVLFALTGGALLWLNLGQRAFYTLVLLCGAWVLWALPVVGLVADVKAHWEGGQLRGYRWRTVFSLLAFMIYAPVIAIVSIFARPEWKGRRL